MKAISLCCMLLLLTLACRKSDNNNSNNNATEMFPSKPGDTWVYLVNDTTSKYGSPDSIRQFNMTVTVIDSIQLPGGIKANVWVYSAPGEKDTNYVFQQADTIKFVDINQVYYSVYSRQYIVPFVLNNSWQYSVPSIHNVTVDRHASVTVEQHQFDNAFRISGLPGMPDAIIYTEEWIENNVGLVKRYRNTSGTNLGIKHRTSWSLVSYRLG
jgi:hypothetical protein